MKNLDKEEFRVKLEEINHLVEQKDYKGAMNVVDSIDWRRVKNVRTLCVVGEIYAANKRYEDSKEIFLLAYHRASIGKNILYRLVEVSLKLGQVSEAVEFYQEYREVAPNDNTQYILKYKILKVKKAPLAEQIKVLEDYKEKEFTEKWSYELAKLYYQDGDKEKCLELCNEIILWFNEGNYVNFPVGVKKFIKYCQEKDEATNRPYTSRYIGSLVADFHRNMLKGGVFLYPQTSSHPTGKLRLLYECNPMAFIAEQSGGLATDGEQRILEIKPEALHQRVPLYTGSKKMVQKVQEFLTFFNNI